MGLISIFWPVAEPRLVRAWASMLMMLMSAVAPSAEQVILNTPLTTVVRTSTIPAGDATAVMAVIVVPEGIPGDLGVGGFVTDDEGTWWQCLQREPLTPGRHALSFNLSAATTRGEPHRGRWSPRHAEMVNEAGLFFWSEQPARNRIIIEHLSLNTTQSSLPHSQGRFVCDNFSITGTSNEAGALVTTTGERIAWHLRPDPFPVDVYDPYEFSLTLTLTSEQHQEQVTGFYRQPMHLKDVGSQEQPSLGGTDGFEVRWRPRHPGIYQVQLESVWQGQAPVISDLPPITVIGSHIDPYVRVDLNDPRFFRVNGNEFYWPVGINAHSVSDPRGHRKIGSRYTPDRGWHSYHDYLERWAAHGLQVTEIWMSSWNLALEWRDDWPGYHGIEAYNQANAERLDRILDHAWKLGIRVNLVINNHGQASTRADKEWDDNPWNANLRRASPEMAGPLDKAEQWFLSKRAFQGQDRMRRYIIARWADHPAIFGWKLTSEEDLTDASRLPHIDQSVMRGWHQQAADAWYQLDPYKHPVTSHWSDDYDNTDRDIVALDELHYICIDAYHLRHRRDNQRGYLLGDLIWEGVNIPRRGLQIFNKPIWVTEFGGAPMAAVETQLLAEHESGPWAAAVSGYGAAPMLWWLEWVDQSDRYDALHALTKFMAGEDLRSQQGSTSRSVPLQATSSNRSMWCRAWARPGRILGYVMDYRWGYDGRYTPSISDAAVEIGTTVAAGSMSVQWWDCHNGTIVAETKITHPGGPLRLEAPTFRKHLAFKMWRHESP